MNIPLHPARLCQTAIMPAGSLFGAIEAGGTKFLCGIGTGPEDIRIVHIATTSPEQTVAAAVAWLREQGGDQLAGVGIGSFGPVDINPESPTWGYITSTPKPGWRNFDFAGAVKGSLGLPLAFNSDVNAAVLGEVRWGAARNISSCLYLTVGTGIGGGAVAAGRLLPGTSHPEMGHIRVPHDFTRDPYPGACPFHGDCLEGLASGPALEGRWGVPAASLGVNHPAWKLEANYLAHGIANFACTLSPELVLLGGGVMRQAALMEMIRREVSRLLGGYIATPAIESPALGQRAGILGALSLALSASAV